jgi:phage terminase large subunit-like protein
MKKNKIENEAKTIVLKYCSDILENKIPHNVYTKKAVRRFLNDIKHSQEEGYDYYIDFEYLQKFYDFTKTLKLSDKDEFLKLLPWQLFVFANLLGFKYKANPEKKRFRQGALFVPRKNGKTSGILNCLLLWDFLETPSSESYFFEKDERQSVKIYNDLKTVVKKHPELSKICNVSTYAITYQNSRIAYFSSESIGIDGYKPSIAIVDEYFCYPTNRCLTAMRYGSRSRLNGLVLVITTAGNDISLPAYTEYEKCEKILNGILEDDTYFAMIFGIDAKDKWDTKQAYLKANPSIGYIIDEKILEQDLQDAIATPSNRNDYKSKTLSIWSNEISNWIPLEKWDTEKRNTDIDFTTFKNQNCCGALDLSSVNDFSAYTLCFNKDDTYYFKHRFYIPEEQIQQKYLKENTGILNWIESGYIIATPGASIDYDYILNDILKIGRAHV